MFSQIDTFEEKKNKFIPILFVRAVPLVPLFRFLIMVYFDTKCFPVFLVSFLLSRSSKWLYSFFGNARKWEILSFNCSWLCNYCYFWQVIHLLSVLRCILWSCHFHILIAFQPHNNLSLGYFNSFQTTQFSQHLYCVQTLKLYTQLCVSLYGSWLC